MLTFEALTIGFFAVLAAAAPFVRASRAHRLRAALWSVAVIVCVLVAVQALAPAVRVWLGHAYLVMGYWIPALMIPSMAGGFETWLARTDEWWRLHRIPAPNWLRDVLELSYLLCYPLVPAAFTFVWMYGRLADTDRFWTAVLLSGFACYGTLPWLISRPPRVRPPSRARRASASLAGSVRERGPTSQRWLVGSHCDPTFGGGGKPDVSIVGGTARTGLRAANEFVLARVSHGMNTFPSGHVAVSVAAGFEVMSISRPAGLVMLIIAVLIAAGAVAGRYHYAVDVASGMVVGIAASSLV